MKIHPLTDCQVLALTTPEIKELLTKCANRIIEIRTQLDTVKDTDYAGPSDEKLSAELRTIASLRRLLWSELQEKEGKENIYNQAA
ncbi:hypothetical protein [Hymenobacter crusticola]|uniref:Transcription elongation factor GreA/GreB N-terminal domain-containing protein n=1 Tax=Hymenobacter crusticola TaxID=1770526 RepID=A0A243W5J2_9BACT|nr:hypothetical protein [Hymenobacter crusticola]OUJ68602.1 hypothetical protein BXP70_27790 [Hymenobacter crusticola]